MSSSGVFGQIGVAALRALIVHPRLELAGVIVHDARKEGRDAGDLCGLPDTNVIATRDVEAAQSIDADAVGFFASGDYRYREAAMDVARCLRRGMDVARCLRRGMDVVCTSLLPMRHPPAADDATRDLLLAACIDGGSSFFDSGVDPSWANDVLAVKTLTSFSSNVEKITMLEFPDYAPIDNDYIMFDLMGFGHPPEHPAPLFDTERLSALWAPTVHFVADGIGLPLYRVHTTLEKWIAPDRYEVASGWIEAGAVGGMHFTVAGIVADEERVVLEHFTRMGGHAAPDWPTFPSEHGGYRIIVDGLPTYTVDLEMHGRGSNMRGPPMRR